MHQRLYLPFTHPHWRMTMGLKPLQPHDWIDVDDYFVPYLRRKQELLQYCHSEVFASLPGTEQAQTETLHLLLNHLVDRFPNHYQWHGGQIKLLPTQQTWNIEEFELNPLDLAGRLVQDDLCLMQPGSDGYILAAASICFPAHWRLQEKLGKSLTPIHQPVPDYSEKLEHPVNHVFDRLQISHPSYRLNWGIADTPELFLPPQQPATPKQASLTASNAGQQLWIRVERQTLRRLEISHYILFTIRTYLYPLSVLEQHCSIAQNLSAIIQQMPSTMQQYKQIASIRNVLLEYLSHIYNR